MKIFHECYTVMRIDEIKRKSPLFVRVADGIAEQWIDGSSLCLTSFFPKQALVLTCLQYKSFGNNVGKGEIARNEQFLLIFSRCFLPV